MLKIVKSVTVFLVVAIVFDMQKRLAGCRINWLIDVCLHSQADAETMHFAKYNKFT